MQVKRIFLLLVPIIILAGCQNSEKNTTISENESLKAENKRLAQQLEESQVKIKQLQQQVKNISVIEGKIEPEDIYNLENVKITRYTNIYDKDEDGIRETLIVYIQPSDAQGDAVKAAGDVEVQLWDLNKTENEALLGQWKITNDKLKDLWFATMVSTNYRLIFDVVDKVKNYNQPLTVKMTFTDYLTGKVFIEQKVIKP